jgi:predicted AAA+ superfamily ATPase
MAFLSGARHVGKTTCSRSVAGTHEYMNWENPTHRALFARGPEAVAEHLRLPDGGKNNTCVVFDEIHKYSKWKSFLKGFYDVYGDRCRTIVTGSARMDVSKPGGDSLMGRYFLYRMHPLSVAELLSRDIQDKEIRPPRRIDDRSFEQLLTFGGFPEPFLKANTRFYNRWKRLKMEQFFNEDILDLTRVYELGQLKLLVDMLQAATSAPANYSWLASNINVTVDTIRRWLEMLERLHYCFIVRPWYRNVRKSLRKQPKIYLWDWSLIKDPAARAENFMASHLLKAVHYWTDIGHGDYGLYFLRDKAKREVNFLVTRNDEPWFLVEVESSGKQDLNPNLKYFQDTLHAPYAFQAAFDMDFVESDCFTGTEPVRVPAKTFLSQLI